MQVWAFATSEDAADVAVTNMARDVAVVMHAAAQAIVATSVVRHSMSDEDEDAAFEYFSLRAEGQPE